MSNTDTNTSTDAVIIAEHRYGWTTMEIVTIIAVTVVPLVAVLIVSEDIKAWLLPILGVAGSVMLWNLGRHRKNASALRLTEDSNGVWHMSKGGKDTGLSGTRVTFDNVNSIAAVTDSVGRRDIILAVLGDDNTQTESIRINERLFIVSPLLRESVTPLVDKYLKGTDKSRAMDVIGTD